MGNTMFLSCYHAHELSVLSLTARVFICVTFFQPRFIIILLYIVYDVYCHTFVRHCYMLFRNKQINDIQVFYMYIYYIYFTPINYSFIKNNVDKVTQKYRKLIWTQFIPNII